MSNYTFVIVAEGDTPVYEAEFLSTQKKDGQDTSHLNQLIIHAALDMVDDTVWTTNAMCAQRLLARTRADPRAPMRDARAHCGPSPVAHAPIVAACWAGAPAT
jgi:hypothetical protein